MVFNTVILLSFSLLLLFFNGNIVSRYTFEKIHTFYGLKVCVLDPPQNFYGKRSFLVLAFSDDSHFSHYILFLPLFVFILKNASRFGSCRYIKNGNCTADKRHALLADVAIKIIIKNATSAFKLEILIY